MRSCRAGRGLWREMLEACRWESAMPSLPTGKALPNLRLLTISSASSQAGLRLLSSRACQGRRLLSQQGTGLRKLQMTRSFASQAAGAPGSRQTSTLAKILVLTMLVLVGARITPAVVHASVEHAMMLMGSDEAFWQQSGLQRAKWIAKTDAGIEKLVKGGCAQRLVNILDDSTDPECRKTALEMIEGMSRVFEAREALVIAGLPGVLKKRLQDADGFEQQYTQLLIQYRIQQNHVE